MRWPIVRLICARELRDLCRDRRTLLMLLGLPVMLYPLFGIVGFLFALTMLDQKLVIGVVGTEHLPPLHADSAFVGPAQTLGWLGLTDTGGGLAQPLALANVQLARGLSAGPPPLLHNGTFLSEYLESDSQLRTLVVVPLTAADPAADLLAAKKVDAVVTIPPGFVEAFTRNERTKVEVAVREGEEISRLAGRRAVQVLKNYNEGLKLARLGRVGLPAKFDKPLDIRDPVDGGPVLKRTSSELREMLGKFLPFILVMWAMAGALYPAIDLCAGEKERGTMETLLISPADRREIVLGKFGAIWAFSSATALWNLLWLGGGSLVGGTALGVAFADPLGLLLCVLFAVPQAALFSACCLGLGAFARSSKEGQYYLLPMFMLTMPLVLLSLAPGAELSALNCWIPVTGSCLLLQQMLSGSPDSRTYLFIGPVFGALVAAIALALSWAVAQFHREDVLFREAERIDFFAKLRSAVRGRSLPGGGR